MNTKDYILSVLKLPFEDEDKATMIVKLVNAGIAAGVADVSSTTIGKAPAVQAQPPVPVVAPDLLVPKPPVAAPQVSDAATWHAENGLRVMDIVQRGTPGTVYLPVTGNTVSLPADGAGVLGGELAMGYLNRVKVQLHSADLVNRALATIATGFSAIAQHAGIDVKDTSKWPEIADRACNAAAYMTASQAAADAFARQQMVSGLQNSLATAGTPLAQPEPDTVPVAFDPR